MKALITFLFLFVCTMVVAQTTNTYSKTISIDKLDQLNNHLIGDVEVIETKSQRVTIEYTVSVYHSTKASAVAKHIAMNELATPSIAYDVNTREAAIVAPTMKAMIVDKEDADIKVSYKLYVPSGLNIR